MKDDKAKLDSMTDLDKCNEALEEMIEEYETSKTSCPLPETSIQEKAIQELIKRGNIKPKES